MLVVLPCSVYGLLSEQLSVSLSCITHLTLILGLVFLLFGDLPLLPLTPKLKMVENANLASHHAWRHRRKYILSKSKTNCNVVIDGSRFTHNRALWYWSRLSFLKVTTQLLCQKKKKRQNRFFAYFWGGSRDRHKNCGTSGYSINSKFSGIICILN